MTRGVTVNDVGHPSSDEPASFVYAYAAHLSALRLSVRPDDHTHAPVDSPTCDDGDDDGVADSADRDHVTLSPQLELLFLLSKVGHLAVDRLTRGLSRHSLTFHQLEALLWLSAHPGISTVELARIMQITPQSVGSVLRPLVAAKLISTGDPGRGKASALLLLPYGTEAVIGATSTAEGITAHAFRSISSQQTTEAKSFLAGLLNELRKPYRRRSLKIPEKQDRIAGQK